MPYAAVRFGGTKGRDSTPVSVDTLAQSRLPLSGLGKAAASLAGGPDVKESIPFGHSEDRSKKSGVGA